MKKIFIFGFILLGVACAHHNDVRPGEGGVHRVLLQTDDTDEAMSSALKQAQHYCSERNKEAVIVSEDKKYTGKLSEEEYNKGKTIAKVAKGVGSAAWVFGGKNESGVGGVTALGGQVADNALGKGYTVETKFKCQ